MDADEKQKPAEGPCTFLVQRPDRTWTYCGQPAQSIWLHAAAGRYFRCGIHRPSQLDVHMSGQRQH